MEETAQYLGTCPSCGYAEEGKYTQKPIETLQKERLNNLFGIHLSMTWWVTQPLWIAKKVKNFGIAPKNVLDLGCGDGRWVHGLTEVFPGIRYTGIDLFQEHIELCQQTMPEHNWRLCNFEDFESPEYFDLILIGGTLNPAMDIERQKRMFNKVKRLDPKYIVCSFDLNQTGHKPAEFIEDKYHLLHELKVDTREQGPRQNIVVWIYGLSGRYT